MGFTSAEKINAMPPGVRDRFMDAVGDGFSVEFLKKIIVINEQFEDAAESVLSAICTSEEYKKGHESTLIKYAAFFIKNKKRFLELFEKYPDNPAGATAAFTNVLWIYSTNNDEGVALDALEREFEKEGLKD